MILIGGLLSPCKWLVLLALADQGFWFPVYMIRDYLSAKAVKKRFLGYYKEHGISPDPSPEISSDKNLKVRIEERDEELIWHYSNSFIYQLHIPKLYFSIVKDSDGNEKIMVERCNGKDRQVEVKAFADDGVFISDIRFKKSIFNVKLNAVTVLQH